jgi:hypothetical protein
MLVEHIDQDLQLAPAEDSADVSRQLIARASVNGECGDQSEIAGWHETRTGPGQLVLFFLCVFGGGLVIRRRVRGGGL